jgi:hypothetical protein
MGTDVWRGRGGVASHESAFSWIFGKELRSSVRNINTIHQTYVRNLSLFAEKLPPKNL